MREASLTSIIEWNYAAQHLLLNMPIERRCGHEINLSGKHTTEVVGNINEVKQTVAPALFNIKVTLRLRRSLGSRTEKAGVHYAMLLEKFRGTVEL